METTAIATTGFQCVPSQNDNNQFNSIIMSNITFGKSIEYKVASEMMREGFDVYLPTADDHGIDMIAKTIHGNIVEVQVKSLRKTTKGGVFAAFLAHFVSKVIPVIQHTIEG